MLTDILISVAIGIGPLIALLIIGSIFGTMAQRRHIADLDRREADMQGFLLSNYTSADGSRGELVTGSTVVAYDFFRRVAVIFRKLIGGRFKMHEGFMMRARREAILRMAEDARSRGASAVHNVRLVSANLGDNSRGSGGCEVVAYGTAIWD